jgi:hypothetical protein
MEVNESQYRRRVSPEYNKKPLEYNQYTLKHDKNGPE